MALHLRCYTILRSTADTTPYMVSITQLQSNDGSIRYRAVVMVKRGTRMFHNETRTFCAKLLAVAWATQCDFQLKHSGRDNNASPSKSGKACNIAQLIARYIFEFQSIQRSGRTREHHLRLLEKMLDKWDVTTLSTGHPTRRSCGKEIEATRQKGGVHFSRIAVAAGFFLGRHIRRNEGWAAILRPPSSAWPPCTFRHGLWRQRHFLLGDRCGPASITDRAS
jgi:hypothetical protein